MTLISLCPDSPFLLFHSDRKSVGFIQAYLLWAEELLLIGMSSSFLTCAVLSLLDISTSSCSFLAFENYRHLRD